MAIEEEKTPPEFEAPEDQAHVHISVVTQTSLELLRMTRLNLLFDRWPGNITALLVDTTGTNKYMYDQLVEKVNTMGRSDHVELHYHLEKSVRADYPINRMRNMAVALSRNDHFILLDVDFVPSRTLFRNLMEYHDILSSMESEKTALVIPALDLKDYRKITLVNTKKDVVEHWGKTVEMFHKKFKRGHQPTNYEKWMTAETVYNVSYASQYEPYFVCHKANCPLYREEFIGFGYNKAAQVYEMWANDFEFLVMPKDFVFHIPHPYSRKTRHIKNLLRSREKFIEMQKEILATHGKVFQLFKDEPVVGVYDPELLDWTVE